MKTIMTSIRAAFAALMIAIAAPLAMAQAINGSSLNISGAGEIGAVGIGAVPYPGYGFTEVSPTGQSPNYLRVGSAGAWAFGQNAGPGSGDDTFGVYSYTHGALPLIQWYIDGSSVVNYDLFVMGETACSHYTGLGAAPSIIAGSAAGTGASVSIVGTDGAGTIDLVEGTAPSLAGLATVTFAVAYLGPVTSVTLTPANLAARLLTGANGVYIPNEIGVEVVSQTGFYLFVAGGALTPGVEYKFMYHVN